MCPSDPDHVFWAAVRGDVPPPPCAVVLGSTFVEIEPDSGRVVMQFDATADLTNPMGNIQGGFVAAMLDDTMGPACATTYGTNEFSTTLELKVNFLRPAKPGRFIGTAEVVQRGKSISFVQGELRDADGNLVATATSTVRLIRVESEQFWAPSS